MHSEESISFGSVADVNEPLDFVSNAIAAVKLTVLFETRYVSLARSSPGSKISIVPINRYTGTVSATEVSVFLYVDCIEFRFMSIGEDVLGATPLD